MGRRGMVHLLALVLILLLAVGLTVFIYASSQKVGLFSQAATEATRKFSGVLERKNKCPKGVKRCFDIRKKLEETVDVQSTAYNLSKFVGRHVTVKAIPTGKKSPLMITKLQATKPVYTPKVLMVVLNPKDATGNLAERYFKWVWGGRTLPQFESYIIEFNANAFTLFSQGRIDYQFVKTLRVETSPKYTNGFQFTVDNYQNCINSQRLPNGLTCEEQKAFFDHDAFVADNNLCLEANQTNADEIWLLTSPYLTRWESWMLGPDYSFWPNGGDYVNAVCNRHLIVDGPSYASNDTFLHPFGHRVEATLRFITDIWSETDRKKYVEDFANLTRYSLPPANTTWPTPGCGNAHFPLNALNHYDYFNQTNRDFNCSDWNNISSFSGTTESFNCQAWGCTGSGWQMVWLGGIPRLDGQFDVALRSGKTVSFRKDWWYYLLYPDNAIKFVRDNKASMAPTKGNLENWVVQEKGTR